MSERADEAADGRATGRRHSPVEQPALEPHRCTPSEQRRLLSGAPFFAALPARDLDAIAPTFRQSDYIAGATIHRAGDPASRLSIVVAGRVKIVRPTLDGQDVLLAILGPGDAFGSLPDLGDAAYPDDATAQSQCCVLWTTAEEFRRTLERYPAAALATLDLVAGRLRAAHATIEQLSAYPVDRRVAAALLTLVDRLGRPEGDALLIDAQISRQDLAGMTGATVETVSRVLSQFRRDGLVESGRRWIAVRDRARLAALVHSGEE